MSKSNTFENDLLNLIFNATAIANLADNAATSPLTNLYVSLHTIGSGDGPGEAGNQTTNEVSTVAYVGYTRVAVARSAGGWTISTNSVSPIAAIDFPECTGGTGATITHFAIGTASSGTGKILYYGTVTPNISVSTNVTPRLTTASTITEE